MEKKYILTLSCKDTHGIVASVTKLLADEGGFIIESAQFGDFSTGIFFMRTEFSSPKTLNQMRDSFLPLAQKFKMSWNIYDLAIKPKVLLLVSKQGHCLNDILHRYHTGSLPIEIPAIISNHETLKPMVEWLKVPFIHLPVSKENKQEQEEKILGYVNNSKADFVVLARYMQILSPKMCDELKGRAINIHHSFLPSFKGAKPYHQAYDRGVKLIGATAHFVTKDLDEGPIIEQEVARVDHTQKPEQLTAIGEDIESMVLARALKYVIEHRVLLNGNKTVVFK